MRPLHSRFRTVSSIILCFIMSVAIIGCAPPTGTVSGKVTHQGKALKGGNVTLASTDGGPSFSGTITEDGSYRIQNVRGGSYKVCVETDSLKPPAGAGYHPGSGGPKKGPSTTMAPGVQVPEGYKPSNPAEAAVARNAKRYVQIPESYAKPETTDLSYTFPGGEQSYDINLK